MMQMYSMQSLMLNLADEVELMLAKEMFGLYQRTGTSTGRSQPTDITDACWLRPIRK